VVGLIDYEFLDKAVLNRNNFLGDYLKLDREKRVCPLFTLNNFLIFLWGSLRGLPPPSKIMGNKKLRFEI